MWYWGAPQRPSRGHGLILEDRAEAPVLSELCMPAVPSGCCTGAPAGSVGPQEGMAIPVLQKRRSLGANVGFRGCVALLGGRLFNLKSQLCHFILGSP